MEPLEAAGGDPLEKSRCEDLVSKALLRCPAVRRLTDALSQLGVPSDQLVRCIHCPNSESAGGYLPNQRKVVLCQQWVSKEPSEVENTLSHELIHAYDDARAYLDWANLTQHACTEIRAAHISGDCSFRKEIDRGNIYSPTHIAGAGDRCVRRRAELSVAMTCGDPAAAQKAVARAWKICRDDYAPFERGQI